MALIVTHPDKFGTQNLTEAFVVVAAMNLDFSTQSGRIVYNIFKNQSAFTSGKQLYDQVAINLSAVGAPAEDANGNVLTKQADGTYQNNNGETVVPTKLELAPFSELIKERTISNTDNGKTVFQIIAELLYQKAQERNLFDSAVDAGLAF